MRSGDYNAIVERGNNRTSHQGQLICKLEIEVGQTVKWPNEKVQKEKTTIYITTHCKLKIEQHEPY